MTTNRDALAKTDSPAWIRSRAHRRRWMTVLTAMATATAAWGIAVSLLGIDLAVRTDAQTVRQVSSLAVTLTSLSAGFAAWGLLAVLERWTRKARLVWTVAAAVALLVSLLGPLAAQTPAATAVLMGMHGIVAAILIFGLRSTHYSRASSSCPPRAARPPRPCDP